MGTIFESFDIQIFYLSFKASYAPFVRMAEFPGTQDTT
jgi:hypothetical protein